MDGYHLEHAVENEVYAGKLLQTLKKAAGSKALAQRALEAVEICGLPNGQLILVIRSDLGELFHQRWMVDIESPQGAQ